MSVRDKLKKAAADRRFATVSFMGEQILCKLHTLEGIEDLQKQLSGADEKKAGSVLMEYIPNQFLDPEDKEPIWTAEELRKNMTNKDMNELVTLFFKANGDIGAEEKEKN